MVRTTQRDWIEVGLQILSEQGAMALTIDSLTARMGMTKGSFYHHFQSYQGYKETLLEMWVEEGTRRVIEHVEKAHTPLDKMRRLLELSYDEYRGSEVALRAWALQDDVVREYQTRVDAERIAYVQKLFHPIFESEAQTLLMARMFYALYVGTEQLMPRLEARDALAIFEDLMRVYGMTPK